MTRALWQVAGILALAAGAAGVVLPLVPTTPFLLLAAYAFSRSSERLHGWLLSHPRFGPPITNWNSHGAIGRPAKMAAVVAMIAALGVSIAAGVSSVIIATQAVVLVGVAAFLLTRPLPPT